MGKQENKPNNPGFSYPGDKQKKLRVTISFKRQQEIKPVIPLLLRGCQALCRGFSPNGTGRAARRRDGWGDRRPRLPRWKRQVLLVEAGPAAAIASERGKSSKEAQETASWLRALSPPFSKGWW